MTFTFADPDRRTWLALSRDAAYYHIVTPLAADDRLVQDGLRQAGQLGCTCRGGRYRGTCYVVTACEALEAGAAPAEPEPDWFGRTPEAVAS